VILGFPARRPSVGYLSNASKDFAGYHQMKVTAIVAGPFLLKGRNQALLARFDE
jgi:hypothetical protein